MAVVIPSGDPENDTGCVPGARTSAGATLTGVVFRPVKHKLSVNAGRRTLMLHRPMEVARRWMQIRDNESVPWVRVSEWVPRVSPMETSPSPIQIQELECERGSPSGGESSLVIVSSSDGTNFVLRQRRTDVASTQTQLQHRALPGALVPTGHTPNHGP